jgi:hypothetical protein
MVAGEDHGAVDSVSSIASTNDAIERWIVRARRSFKEEEAGGPDDEAKGEDERGDDHG